MTDRTVELLAVAAAPTITALAALIASMRNARKIGNVHRTFNSRMDEMLRMTRAEGHAEGVEDERTRRGAG